MGRWFGSASFASNCSAWLPWSIYYIASWEECKKQYNTLPRGWVVVWTLMLAQACIVLFIHCKDVNISFLTTTFWAGGMTISFSFLYFDLWSKPSIFRGPISCNQANLVVRIGIKVRWVQGPSESFLWKEEDALVSEARSEYRVKKWYPIGHGSQFSGHIHHCGI